MIDRIFTPSYFPIPSSLCWALEQKAASGVEVGSCCVEEAGKNKGKGEKGKCSASPEAALVGR